MMKAPNRRIESINVGLISDSDTGNRLFPEEEKICVDAFLPIASNLERPRKSTCLLHDRTSHHNFKGRQNQQTTRRIWNYMPEEHQSKAKGKSYTRQYHCY